MSASPRSAHSRDPSPERPDPRDREEREGEGTPNEASLPASKMEDEDELQDTRPSLTRSSRSPSPQVPARPRRDSSPKRDGQTSNQGNTLFVSNLSRECLEPDLDKEFSKFGKLKRIQVMRDPPTGIPRGFAFVTFEEASDGMQAMEQLNGKELFGRNVRIELGKRGRPRTPTPGKYMGPPKPLEIQRVIEAKDRHSRGFRDRERSRDYDHNRHYSPPSSSSFPSSSSSSKHYGSRDYDRHGSGGGGWGSRGGGGGEHRAPSYGSAPGPSYHHPPSSSSSSSRYDDPSSRYDRGHRRDYDRYSRHDDSDRRYPIDGDHYRGGGGGGGGGSYRPRSPPPPRRSDYDRERRR